MKFNLRYWIWVGIKYNEGSKIKDKLSKEQEIEKPTEHAKILGQVRKKINLTNRSNNRVAHKLSFFKHQPYLFHINNNDISKFNLLLKIKTDKFLVLYGWLLNQPIKINMSNNINGGDDVLVYCSTYCLLETIRSTFLEMFEFISGFSWSVLQSSFFYTLQNSQFRFTIQIHNSDSQKMQGAKIPKQSDMRAHFDGIRIALWVWNTKCISKQVQNMDCCNFQVSRRQ